MPVPYNPLDANARQAWLDAQRTGAVGAPGGINPLSGMDTLHEFVAETFKGQRDMGDWERGVVYLEDLVH